jgi:hypothetical protein
MTINQAQAVENYKSETTFINDVTVIANSSLNPKNF